MRTRSTGPIGTYAVVAVVAVVLGAALGGFPWAAGVEDRAEAGPGETPAAPPIRYTDVTEEAGIRFVHRHGGTGEKYLPEAMSGGVILFDFDGDGDLDLYFIQAGKLPAVPGQAERNVLYRNDGGWKFTDVSRRSGLDDDGYGMGGAIADIDNDGNLDVYVTNFGPNRLYRNEGDGTFTEVSERAGVGDPLFGASAAFGDVDRDGHVDLYVVNFLDFTVKTHKKCGQRKPNVQAYCHPDEYSGADDRLFRNRGDGRFEDVTRRCIQGPLQNAEAERWLSGEMVGKGLGVVFTDCDLDGDLDIYVANNSTRNYLFRNQGDGKFEEDFTGGVAFNKDGKTEGSSGVDAGDVDGDGRMDLFTVHLDGETNTLYRQEEELGFFSDCSQKAGLAVASVPFVGFGTNLFDCDNDGDLDIFVANGHIVDNIGLYRPGEKAGQANLLFQNNGAGRFSDVSRSSGDYFLRETVSRGSAVGDLDNDGDLDLVVCQSNGPPALLRNDGGERNHSVLFHLTGSRSNRAGIGARVTIEVGEVERTAEVRSGSSYLSQSDLRLHFGLGKATRVKKATVHWPSGTVETFEDLPADHLIFIKEGEGITRRQPMGP